MNESCWGGKWKSEEKVVYIKFDDSWKNLWLKSMRKSYGEEEETTQEWNFIYALLIQRIKNLFTCFVTLHFHFVVAILIVIASFVK